MSCPICEWKENIIYEDDKAIAIMADKPVTKGHIIVFPREHVTEIEKLEAGLLSHLMTIANSSASALFELYGGGNVGTNIIVNEGKGSNRRFEHITLDVIPRAENDGVNYRWEPKQGNQVELTQVAKSISDETFFIGKDQEKEPVILKPKAETIDSEDNYLVKQLDRIP